VGLDVVDLVRRDPRVRERVADQRLLRQDVGYREPGRPTILVHGATAHHGQDSILLALGVRERLQHHEPAALATDGAVGARVERLATAVGSVRAELDPGLRAEQRQDQIHAARERDVALSRAQALAGQMHRHERRRAGRIDRDRRAVQAEGIRDPPRRERDRIARRGVHVALVGGHREEALRVVVRRHADEHAGARPGEPLGEVARRFERLPGHFEREPLLRIEALGLLPRDVEERVVEGLDRVEQQPRPELSELARRRITGPARVVELADRIDAVRQDVPELARIGAAAREATADADDGDRLAGRARGRQLGHRRAGGWSRLDMRLRARSRTRALGARRSEGFDQVGRQRGHGRKRPDQRGGKRDARERLEPVAQLHPGQ
jgi:hypothetical protein